MVNIQQKISSASCGITHTCILTASGIIYSFGNNNFGQLGIGNKKTAFYPTVVKIESKSAVTKISCGHYSAAINKDQQVYVWGTGSFGEFVAPKLLDLKYKVVDVCVGGCFSTLIDSNGNVYSWGSNSCGELGLGDYRPRSNPTLVKKIENRRVHMISCGSDYTMAIGPVKSRQKIIAKEPADQLQTSFTFTVNRTNDIFPKFPVKESPKQKQDQNSSNKSSPKSDNKSLGSTAFHVKISPGRIKSLTYAFSDRSQKGIIKSNKKLILSAKKEMVDEVTEIINIGRDDLGNDLQVDSKKGSNENYIEQDKAKLAELTKELNSIKSIVETQ